MKRGDSKAMQMYEAITSIPKLSTFGSLGAWKPCLLFFGINFGRVRLTCAWIYRRLLWKFSTPDLEMSKAMRFSRDFELTCNRFSGRPKLKTLPLTHFEYQTQKSEMRALCRRPDWRELNDLCNCRALSAAACFFHNLVLAKTQHSVPGNGLQRRCNSQSGWRPRRTYRGSWNQSGSLKHTYYIWHKRLYGMSASQRGFFLFCFPDDTLWTFPSSISMLIPQGTGKSILWLGIVTAQCNTTANSSRQDRNEEVPI